MFAHLQVKLIFSFITLRYLNIHKHFSFSSINASWACITSESNSRPSLIFHSLNIHLSFLAFFHATTASAAQKHWRNHSLKKRIINSLLFYLRLLWLALPSSFHGIIHLLKWTCPFQPCGRWKPNFDCAPYRLRSNRKWLQGKRRTRGQSKQLA